MSEPIYDVVIVGAGVAGAILAKTLTRAGKTVLILEAGVGTSTLDLDGDAAQKEYEGYLQTYYKAAAKVPNAPYPNLPAAPSPDVLDIANINGITPSTNGYFVQAGPMPFGSDYARTPGGTTLHWVGTTLRMLPNDFRMKTTYGVAEDWPFSYDELKPYYEMAEHEIGVSATVQQLYYPNTHPKTFFGDYQFPMKGLPPSYMDQKMAKATQGAKVKWETGVAAKRRSNCVSRRRRRGAIPCQIRNTAGKIWFGTSGRKVSSGRLLMVEKATSLSVRLGISTPVNDAKEMRVACPFVRCRRSTTRSSL